MRGESERVATRVRDLLSDYADEPAGAPPVGVPPVDVPPVDVPPVGVPPVRVPPVDVPRSPLVSWGQRLRSRMPVRLEPRRGASMIAAAAVVVVVIVAAAWFTHRRPASPAAAPLPTAAATAASSSAAAQPSPTSPTARPVVVVDVAGRVRRPGVYRLPSGARVVDALRAAGGARRGVNLNGLDLAAKVVDGQQVAVGVRGAVAGGAGAVPGAGSAASADGGPVDLNSATLEQLETLPGVGPVLGQRILDWRTQHGRFASVAQLKEVSGIGDARFADLQPRVTV